VRHGGRRRRTVPMLRPRPHFTCSCHFPRRPQSLICPCWQETYSTPLKIFRLTRHPNQTYNSRYPVLETEGRWPASRTLGRVAVDAAAFGRAIGSQGGSFRERTSRADDRRLNASAKTSSGSMRAGRSAFVRGSRGRQNRAVLAPVAGVKPMEIVGPDRAFDQSPIRLRRRPEEFGSGENAA
jgi:hypothetical protein